MSKKRLLRKDTHVWLVGPRNANLLGAKFPSKRQVLSTFFHHYQSKGVHEAATSDDSTTTCSCEGVHEAATSTATQLIEKYWDKEGIPSRPKQHVISQIVIVYEKEYRILVMHVVIM